MKKGILEILRLERRMDGYMAVRSTGFNETSGLYGNKNR